MLGTTPEDIAQFLHQEERLDSVRHCLPTVFSLTLFLPCTVSNSFLHYSSILCNKQLQGFSETYLKNKAKK